MSEDVEEATKALAWGVTGALTRRLAETMRELGDPVAIDRETCEYLLSDAGPECIRWKAAMFVADARLLGVL